MTDHIVTAYQRIMNKYPGAQCSSGETSSRKYGNLVIPGGAPQPLHPRLLSRNLLLAGLALLAAAPAAPRALGVFDGFVVLAATAVTVLLYAAIEVWLANQPRLLGLSGR